MKEIPLLVYVFVLSVCVLSVCWPRLVEFHFPPSTFRHMIEAITRQAALEVKPCLCFSERLQSPSCSAPETLCQDFKQIQSNATQFVGPDWETFPPPSCSSSYSPTSSSTLDTTVNHVIWHPPPTPFQGSDNGGQSARGGQPPRVFQSTI